MNDANAQNSRGLASTCSNVDDAVGISKRFWYVAIVNNRSEKSVFEKLTKMGVDTFLPVSKEIHIWKSGKKVKVDRILIPAKIFINCTENERREIVKLPFINRFMTNIAGAPRCGISNCPLAVVPEQEIATLKFMLGVCENVSFTEAFAKGQKIEVIRGPLRGLTGDVREDAHSGSTRLYVNISCLGSASVTISPQDVKLIND